MTRNLKALGLALVAVMAIGAISASAALATPQFTATQYPAEIHGEGGASTAEEFTTEAGTVTCEESTFAGTASAASTTQTVHPTYSECTAFGFVGATVNTEGCNYVFHAETSLVSEMEFTGKTDVTCPAGQSIKIVAGTCRAEVKAQTGLSHVIFKNMTTSETTPDQEDVTVSPTVSGIAYTVTEDGFLCPFNGTGNKTGGTYTSASPVTVRGYVDGGSTLTSEEIGISLSGT